MLATVACGGGDGGKDKDKNGDDSGTIVAVSCPDGSPLAEAPLWYFDGDFDGFGAGDPTQACERPEGMTAIDGDCNDEDLDVHPDADEICNEVDDDCDELVDDADTDTVKLPFWYEDLDEDGWGNNGTVVNSCTSPGTGWVDIPGDCNDNSADISPDAEEVCDTIDNDCDALIDHFDGSLDNDAITLCYTDADGDGHGAPPQFPQCCEPGLEVASDCNDSVPSVFVGATEVACDGIDQDCDGVDLCSILIEDVATAKFFGETADSLVGDAISLGDFDGDGATDIVAPAAGFDGNRGAAYVVRGAVTSGDHALADSYARLEGSVAGDYFGASAAFIGDINGDTYDDLVVGAPGDATGGTSSGAVHLIHGPIIPGQTGADLSDLLLIADPGTGLGTQVASAGDVNDDGSPDFLASSATENVWLVTGDGIGSLDIDLAQARLRGDGADLFGWSMAELGDIDGDGFDDIVIGAPGREGVGAGFVFRGPLSGIVEATSATAILGGREVDGEVGYTVASPGDADGDGLPDVVVSARTSFGGAFHNGGVYVVSGQFEGTDFIEDVASTIIVGPTDEGLGKGLSTPGDIDGDLKDDLAIGSTDYDNYSGRVHLSRGGLNGLYTIIDAADVTIDGQNFEYAGSAVASGDVDGDLRVDLLIGSKGYDSFTGAFYVVDALGLLP